MPPREFPHSNLLISLIFQHIRNSEYILDSLRGGLYVASHIWRVSGDPGGAVRLVDMSDDNSSNRLADLGARIRRVREHEHSRTEQDETAPRGAMSGFGMAMRIGTELVAGLVVGVGIGYMLDRWLGTMPWFLVGFFFLGAGAGILNVYRSASGLGVSPSGGAANRETSQGSGGDADGADDGNQRLDG